METTRWTAELPADLALAGAAPVHALLPLPAVPEASEAFRASGSCSLPASSLSSAEASAALRFLPLLWALTLTTGPAAFTCMQLGCIKQSLVSASHVHACKPTCMLTAWQTLWMAATPTIAQMVQNMALFEQNLVLGWVA